MGTLRLIFPTLTWGDFFDAGLQRIFGFAARPRFRSCVVCAQPSSIWLGSHPRDKRELVQRYIAHLDTTVKAAITDLEDQREALEQDRQGLGLPRQPPFRPADPL